MAVCLTNYPPLYRQFTGSVVVHVAQRRLAAGRPLQGRLDRPVRLHAAAVGRLRRHDRARRTSSADDRLNSMGGRGRNRELAESVVRPWLEAAHRRGDLRARRAVPRAGRARRQRPRRARRWTTSSSAGVFVEQPEGFVAPRSPFLMSASPVAVAAAPAGADDDATRERCAAPRPADRARARPARRRDRARPHRVLGRSRAPPTSSPPSGPTS